MNYKIYKVGRGVNAPKKQIRHCSLCGREITDFRIEESIGGKKFYSCVHCPIQFHYNFLEGKTLRHWLIRWLLKYNYREHIFFNPTDVNCAGNDDDN